MTALLTVSGIRSTYDHVVVALTDVSLTVGPGEIVALLGANGAGKSTTLKAISNLLPAQRGQVSDGRIVFDGQDITRLDPARIVRRGVVQVLEGRHCFRSLTIEENLRTGAAAIRTGRAQSARDIDRIYTIFPRLAEKRRLQAGLASGGEQQMVAIGRALMSHPRLLVLDEPSMGLAPRTVEQIFATLQGLNQADGVAMLIAEQNSVVALRVAHRAYVLEHGSVMLSDTSERLRERDDLRAFYLGQAKPSRACMSETT